MNLRALRRTIWLGIALSALAACSSDAGGISSTGGSGAGGGNQSGAGGRVISGAQSGAGGVPASGGASGASASGGVSVNGGGLGGQAGNGNGGAEATGGAAMGGGGASTSGGSAGAAAGGNGGHPSGGSAGVGGGAGSTSTGGGKGYSPCPTTPGSTCAVLPLGDSISEGFGSSGGGYRVELFSQAVQNDKSLTFVGSLQNGPNTVENKTFPKNHEGHGGYTIASGTGHSGISGPITDQAIANYHPNIVLLMIGTNDINGNIDVASAPNRLANLIDDITTRAPNALVVVATIIPVANTGTNQKVKTYNAAIPGLVSARAAAGKHVLLVDNYAAFTQDPSYQTSLMYNYLHPNDAGYAVLGRSFYGALGALLPGA